eukprot:g10883.t1
MENWHLIASWATCATLGGVSYATTMDPERPDPRARGVKQWEGAKAAVEGGARGAREERSGSVVEVAAKKAAIQTNLGSTKDIMNNPRVAAKFRDAAKAHFCEELYKFLAAFQQYEDMNVDEDEEEGGGTNVQPFPSPLRKHAEVPRHQRQRRRSYQVLRYSVYVGMLGEFFTPGCRHEVNVSCETRRHVRKLMKFCDWVVSSEKVKREVFTRAAQEVRMMLDQNVTGSFIQSSTFVGVAQDLKTTETTARGEAFSKSAQDLKRSELKRTLKKGFRTVAMANSAKNKWAKVAAEGSDIEEAGGRDSSCSTQSAYNVHGAAEAPRKSIAFRSAALGVLATSKYAALVGTGDYADRAELPPLAISVTSPPLSPAGIIPSILGIISTLAAILSVRGYHPEGGAGAPEKTH